ncbi:NADH dehydrogenase subunit 4 (mitochondrion) [Nannochloropsis gaditana]|uniref:NADH-ubiquinone oxidoreductase chain 4 n=1 Tax=Nannochloropsis gaditana TaxID=72520 RepID=K9ZVI0_9STRA|nr:NADH dehydrogenase subunit 4 [Nannochloropsis gaditana]AFZ64332.1 NADH dehydrogenase subunit 4 [Nannochloropsis gaditana]AGI49047.1 NADH dehydrogenase subunit 4 [Nannochloropsis gaditana]AHX24901.1 NADH dehydrogenase subunit 4 [Nannochloropsis gaditana]
MFKLFTSSNFINKILISFLVVLAYNFIISVNLILSFLILFPLFGSFVIAWLPNEQKTLMKSLALIISGITFLFSLALWVNFNKSLSKFQFIETVHYWFPWDSNSSTYVLLGVDGISLFFVILTTLLIFVCLLSSWDNIHIHLKEYLLTFLILESLLLGVFIILDLLMFYILFEATLIPMFIMILTWGSRERKIRAATMLFLYTLFGSVFMLAGIIYIYWTVGSTDYQIVVASAQFTSFEQRLLWLSFFLSFATKVPMLPVHIWLPEAHVEAPTAGSVILAGILLKLGSYGFLRFSLPLFSEANFYFTPLVYSIAVLGVIYTSLTAIRQTDFKRIIAYTSVAHMNIVMIGIYSFNLIGLGGSILQSISHGFVSSALFLIIGVVYDRFHTRLIKYYSGLVHIMPLYALIFLFFTMANIALPGTSSFVGEFLILAGSFKENTTVTFLGATGMILGGAYSLWLYNRVIYGNLKKDEGHLHLKYSYDINRREFYVFLPLIIGTILMGIYPKIFLDPLEASLLNLVFQLKN